MFLSSLNTFFKLLIANLIVFLTISLVIEIGGQIYVYFHPSYKTLPFIPHPVLGWGFIPKSEHITTGSHWYAREFSVNIKINSHGFRDLERHIKKDKNTVRIAILGNSMVTARQIKFEKTAGQLLEKKLNRMISAKTGKKYEVLNFGVPGYGIDQMLLNWNHYASKFNPDYIFIYIFEKNYLRTVSSAWCQRGFLGVDDFENRKCLNIRPLPSIDAKPPTILNQKNWSNIDSLETSGKLKDILLFLEKLPLQINLPSDYETFIFQQKKYIKKELNGKRIIKKPREIFLWDIYSNIKNKILLDKSQIEKNKLRQLHYSGQTEHFPSWNKTNIVNIKLLQDLGKSLKNNEDFIIIDSFQFHNSSNPTTQFSSMWLKTLSSFSRFGYIPLYEKLNESKKYGKSPRWKYDSHLNEIGNNIFADSMYNYLEEKLN
jgi:hypothetical protein